MQKQADKIFSECFAKAVETQNWELLTTAFFNKTNRNYSVNLKDYEHLFDKEIPADTPDIEYVRLLYRAIENIQKKEYDP
ncbi:MAG: hypothetical protein NC402_00910 [Prevotella sp.]|nr:hypothetical protein [Prevotella sp.]MCM1074367.1 hypothetical protein [Ruminococcus sp.]